jgi:hypothetical protein
LDVLGADFDRFVTVFDHFGADFDRSFRGGLPGKQLVIKKLE